MKPLSQAELATKGIILLRGALSRGVYPADQAECLTALCDYATATIQGRARGGSAPKGDVSRENGRKHVAKRL